MKTIGVKTNLRDDDNVAQARPETNHDSESSISSTTFDENDIQVYRFKLAPNVQELVTVFAKMHQYDTRKDYKEAWKELCDENIDIITAEETRLDTLGYDGNVREKMYKAGRYYFRTKSVDKNKKAKKRRQYVSMDNSILTAMDEHIEKNYNNDGYSPASGYTTFVESNKDVLLTEIQRLFAENGNTLTAEDIQHKVKKTYKNRYYLYSRNI